MSPLFQTIGANFNSLARFAARQTRRQGRPLKIGIFSFFAGRVEFGRPDSIAAMPSDYCSFFADRTRFSHGKYMLVC